MRVDKLPFPNGVATGETLKEIYSEGGSHSTSKDARQCMAIGVISKVINLIVKVKKLSIPGIHRIVEFSTGSKGFSAVTLKNRLCSTHH